jgi:hypothetical protein
MNQGPYSSSGDGEISLAIQFQGLRISVQGPAAKALDFVQKLAPESNQTASSSDHPLPASSASAPRASQCPDQYLALATKLSAASVFSPKERVERAWLAGWLARTRLTGAYQEPSPEPNPEFAIVELDLPSKFFVVLQGRGVREVKILRSAKDFKDLSEASVGPVFVGHGFPSETEAKVYIAGAGRASTLGI